MKKYDILDITKLILSFMVVAIHTELFPIILYPWLRLAIPLFFIISSFLFFSKYHNSNDKRKVLKHFVIRLLKLYLFWFILLLPVTLYVRRDWFENGALYFLLNCLIKPFFSSTFVASWYIAALLIGTLIVLILSKLFNYKTMFIIFFMFYLICCYCSSYLFLYDNSIIIKIFKFSLFDPQNSFFVGLIYILFGKFMVDNKVKINRNNNIFFIILFSILLFSEWFILYKIDGSYNNDCYLFLLPTSCLIFNFLIKIEISLKNNLLIRQFSSFIYPLHASLARIINVLLSLLLLNKTICGLFNFIITIFICYISFIIVKKLEFKFKFLKYSY